MLKGIHNEEKPGAPVRDDFIVSLISHERYAEAYTLLSRVNNANIPTLYNIALCDIFAGEYAEALVKIDKAISMGGFQSMNPLADRGKVMSAIEAKQNEDHTHTSPISQEYMTAFPDRVRDNLLRLKIDCHALLGQWGEVIRTASPIINKKFKNVENALAQAQQQTT